MEWHEIFFCDELIPFDKFFFNIYRGKHDEGTAIVNLLRVTPRDHILDVCCGWGRLTIPLIKKGYRITGIDKSEPTLKYAWRWARQEGIENKCNFVLRDVLKMKWKEKFEGAFCVGTSFGFYTKQYGGKDPNLEMLKRIYDVLCIGSQFLLDQINLPAKKIDYYFTDKINYIRIPYYLNPTSRLYTGLYFYHDRDIGSFKVNIWRIKLFIGDELVEMLKKVGFVDVKCFGNLEGDSYHSKSLRLIALAR